eukprot:SAG31_NODE_15263_length_763_cov_1.128012_1_plen_51_part_10
MADQERRVDEHHAAFVETTSALEKRTMSQYTMLEKQFSESYDKLDRRLSAE